MFIIYVYVLIGLGISGAIMEQQKIQPFPKWQQFLMAAGIIFIWPGLVAYGLMYERIHD